MTDPVSSFKTRVVQALTGEIVVYHVGHLALDTASSPTLTQIQMMARGLSLMGRVALRQKRVQHARETLHGSIADTATEYSLKVLKPMGLVDFDVARKVHLENLAA